MKTVNIGMIGSGFAAALHAEAYPKVHGIDVRIKTVASVEDSIRVFADKYHIERVCADYEVMLADPQIDVIDICTPPHLHLSMVKRAILSGKHVICEKPLTGCFETSRGGDGIDIPISKRIMYQSVMESMNELEKLLMKNGRRFMYAENFVYAPSVQKSVEFLHATKNKILFMKAEESHSGSHAFHAAHWKFSGGGSFIRQGCHPLSACIYLKMTEAAARGEAFFVQSVVGDMGVVTACINEEEKRYISARPIDVEDCANVIVTFGDGTKANIVAGDMILGGVRNTVEVFTNEGVHLLNIAPNNHMQVFNATDRNLEQVYITEKVETKTGWQNVFINEEITRGYVDELQDFMECVAFDRTPLSGFELARQTAMVIYAAYLSSEEGIRVSFV